jgi:hypothetical protein
LSERWRETEAVSRLTGRLSKGGGWSQGWKAPRVRLNVGAFASPGRRRPFKARVASASRARRASSPSRCWGFVLGAGRGQAPCLRVGSIRLVARRCHFRAAAGAGERQEVSEVRQVGVNPKWRTDATEGVASLSREAGDPWAVSTQLVTSRKSDTTHRAVACHRVQRRGLSGSRSCSGVHTIAEVDGRHVAQALR